jgi:hypothetical protein
VMHRPIAEVTAFAFDGGEREGVSSRNTRQSFMGNPWRVKSRTVKSAHN